MTVIKLIVTTVIYYYYDIDDACKNYNRSIPN